STPTTMERTFGVMSDSRLKFEGLPLEWSFEHQSNGARTRSRRETDDLAVRIRCSPPPGTTPPIYSLRTTVTRSWSDGGPSPELTVTVETWPSVPRTRTYPLVPATRLRLSPSSRRASIASGYVGKASNRGSSLRKFQLGWVNRGGTPGSRSSVNTLTPK